MCPSQISSLPAIRASVSIPKILILPRSLMLHGTVSWPVVTAESQKLFPSPSYWYRIKTPVFTCQYHFLHQQHYHHQTPVLPAPSSHLSKTRLQEHFGWINHTMVAWVSYSFGNFLLHYGVTCNLRVIHTHSWSDYSTEHATKYGEFNQNLSVVIGDGQCPS